MLKVSSRIVSTYLSHHSFALPARAQSHSPFISRPAFNHLASAIYTPTRTFKMSAPVDANLHKDEVTGEMVSKSCVGALSTLPLFRDSSPDLPLFLSIIRLAYDEESL